MSARSSLLLPVVLAALALALAPPVVTGQQSGAGSEARAGDRPPALEVLDQSRFWIEGTSTVNRFTCHVDVVTGHGPLPTGASSVQQAEPVARDTTGLTIPVRRFDCGNDRMSKDLQEALEAASHPAIRFALHGASVLAAPDTSGGWYRLEALGFLTVAGTERLVRVNAWGQALGDGRYRVRGCKPLEMTYFGVEPPTKFLGVVKVHDRIEVHFDLVAQPSDHDAPPTLALTDPPPCTP